MLKTYSKIFMVSLSLLLVSSTVANEPDRIISNDKKQISSSGSGLICSPYPECKKWPQIFNVKSRTTIKENIPQPETELPKSTED